MARTREDYDRMLAEPNVQRALASIRAAEGTAKAANPYSVGFGFTTIADLSQHPGRTMAGTFKANGKTQKSTAAGAYQFLSGTWNETAKRLGLKDFSPRNQDIAALAKIDERKALGAVLSGDVKTFASKVKGEWASMPGATYGQKTVSQKAIQNAWSNANVPNEAVAPRPRSTALPDIGPVPQAAPETPRQIAMARNTLAPAAPARVQTAGLLSANAPRGLLAAPSPRGLLSTAAPVKTAAAPARVQTAAAPVRTASVATPARAPSTTQVAARVAPSPTRITGVDITPGMAPKGPRVTSPAPAPGGLLAQAAEKNLAARLDRSVPQVAQRAAPNFATAAALTQNAPKTGALAAIGGLLGPSPAAAATMPNAPTLARAAAVTPSYAPARVTPSLASAAVNTAKPAAVANTATPAVRGIAETFDFEGVTPKQREQAIAAIASRPRMAPEAYQTPAFSTAKPRVDAFGQPPISGLQPYKAPAPSVPALSAPKTVPQRQVASVAPIDAQRFGPAAVTRTLAPEVATRVMSPNMAQRVATQPAAPRAVVSAPSFSGPGLPGIPSAPQQSTIGRLGSLASMNRGKIAGGLLGSAIAGPIGGLLGGYLGSRAIEGRPSTQANAAMRAGWDGFSGMSPQAAAAATAPSGGLLSGIGRAVGGLLSGGGFGGSSGPVGASSGSSTSGGGIGPGGSGPRDPSGNRGFAGSSFGGDKSASASNNNTSSSKSPGSSKSSGGKKK